MWDTKVTGMPGQRSSQGLQHPHSRHHTPSTWSQVHRKGRAHTLMSARGPPGNRGPAEPARRLLLAYLQRHDIHTLLRTFTQLTSFNGRFQGWFSYEENYSRNTGLGACLGTTPSNPQDSTLRTFGTKIRNPQDDSHQYQ